MNDKREWVNSRFAEETSGKSLSNKQRAKLLRRLWKEAKRKYG